MKIGQHLGTKDGRRHGNAIIVAQEEHKTLGTLWIIETDFGSTARLTVAEIEECFYTDFWINGGEQISSVAQWRADRRNKQLEAEAFYPS